MKYPDDIINKVIIGDCLEVLRHFPDESVNCCITSPPYWGLRDYGVDGQLGLEKTPEEYVAKMVEIFREVRRVLRSDGTLWLNLGDSYVGSWGNYNPNGSGGQRDKKTERFKRRAYQDKTRLPPTANCPGLKPKDLVGIPWRVALALQQPVLMCSGCGTHNHRALWGCFPNGRLICPNCELSKGSSIVEPGWYLRQDIIWHKPNQMPESVTDRCTKSHEYIFLMSKSGKYYYDNEAIREETVTNDNSNRNRDITKLNNTPGRAKMNGLKTNDYDSRNKRSVWTVNTEPFPEAHFAVYPPKLITPCVLAGCPKDGIVLDPFFGSGTTGLVAKRHGRKYIGIELNQEYTPIQQRRLAQEELF